MEIWKDIKGYEGKYQVSNLGNVRGKKVLSPKINKNGYKEVSLYNGKQKSFYIHRLVAEAFIPNGNKLPQVNHINGDKTNNCVDNLEWISNYDNIQHSIRTGLRDIQTIANITKEKCGKKIKQYDRDGNYIREWLTIREASRELGIERQAIIKVCKGKHKSTNNFIFKYVEG